jgi:hypothetical protein
MRLTEAQKELLAEACDSTLCHCVRAYRPALALVKLGLAVWDESGRDYLYATPAGRLALTSGSKPE